jgi:SM-20-related protein
MDDRLQGQQALTPAREAATERFLEIADAIKAEAGVRVHDVRNTPSGLTWAGMRLISAPEGRTRHELYILARECARVILHSEGKDRNISKDALEYEVAKWAHEALMRHGVNCPAEHLHIDKLHSAKLETDPFEHIIVPGFLGTESIRRINATFPAIFEAGSYPIESVEVGATLEEVINELDSPEFERAVAEKFGIDLTGRPKMYSLRGLVRAKDGQIHTDSKDKIITALLYLNEKWEHEGGRLRLLRDGTDLENFATEVPPDNGTLLVFKRADNSWHGHHPFEGQRRALQMNWMTGNASKGLHAIRHKLSAEVKRLIPT